MLIKKAKEIKSTLLAIAISRKKTGEEEEAEGKNKDFHFLLHILPKSITCNFLTIKKKEKNSFKT